MNKIIKRSHNTQEYDDKKLYASVYAACLAVHETKGVAELVAEKVVTEVEAWLAKKHEVTSNDLRRVAARSLYAYNPDAGYAYLHHRIVS